MVDEIVATEDLRCEPCPLAVVLDSDHERPIGRLVGPVRDGEGVRHAMSVRWLARVLGLVDVVGEGVGHGVEHGDVEHRSVTGPFALVQAGERSREHVHSGSDICRREPGLCHLVWCPGSRRDAGFCLNEGVVGTFARVGALPAVAGVRDRYELWIPCSQFVDGKPESIQCAGTEVLKKYIGFGQESIEKPVAGRGSKVDRDGLLPPAGPHEDAGQFAVDRVVVVAAEVTAGDSFDLDDPGTEIGHLT